MAGDKLIIENKLWKRCSRQPFSTGMLYFRIEKDGRIVNKLIPMEQILSIKKEMKDEKKPQ